MAIDVAALAEQILAGMKGELEPLGAGALSAGKEEATELAQCLADIAEDRAASEDFRRTGQGTRSRRR